MLCRPCGDSGEFFYLPQCILQRTAPHQGTGSQVGRGRGPWRERTSEGKQCFQVALGEQWLCFALILSGSPYPSCQMGLKSRLRADMT